MYKHTHIDRVFTTVSRNLGLKDFSTYTDHWIEWAYEAEKLIGSKNTFIQKEATYTSTGAQASGDITFAANPSSGDSIELNGVKLYFNDKLDLGMADSPKEFYINTTLALTLTDPLQPTGGMIERLKGFSGTGTTPMSPPVQVEYSPVLNYPESLNIADYSVSTTTGALTITAKEIGNKGNDYTLASDNTNAAISGMSLTGGEDMYRNQQLRLPDNIVKLLGVRVGTNDSSYKHIELRRTSAVHRNRVGKSSDDSQQKAFRYYVNGNRLNIQHDDLDEITIVYLAYPTDVRGWPMIKEGHETAVAQYIMWQHKLIDYYNAKVPQYIIKDLERRWFFLCSKVRGDDEMPTSEEMKQIGKMWNTLIPLNNDRGLIDF